MQAELFAHSPVPCSSVAVTGSILVNGYHCDRCMAVMVVMSTCFTRLSIVRWSSAHGLLKNDLDTVHAGQLRRPGGARHYCLMIW
jgi:hypothetical protein